MMNIKSIESLMRSVHTSLMRNENIENLERRLTWNLTISSFTDLMDCSDSTVFSRKQDHSNSESQPMTMTMYRLCLRMPLKNSLAHDLHL